MIFNCNFNKHHRVIYHQVVLTPDVVLWHDLGVMIGSRGSFLLIIGKLHVYQCPVGLIHQLHIFDLMSFIIFLFPFYCHLPVPISNSDFLFSIFSVSQQLSQSSRTDRTKVLELIKKDRLYGCGGTFLMVEQHVKRSCVSVWASVFL